MSINIETLFANVIVYPKSKRHIFLFFKFALLTIYTSSTYVIMIKATVN